MFLNVITSFCPGEFCKGSPRVFYLKSEDFLFVKKIMRDEVVLWCIIYNGKYILKCYCYCLRAWLVGWLAQIPAPISITPAALHLALFEPGSSVFDWGKPGFEPGTSVYSRYITNNDNSVIVLCSSGLKFS